jgi:hypothetical protein
MDLHSFYPEDIDGQIAWLNSFAKAVYSYGPIVELPTTVAAEASDLARRLRFVKLNVEGAIQAGETPDRQTVLTFTKVNRWVLGVAKEIRDHVSYTASLGRYFGIERKLAA